VLYTSAGQTGETALLFSAEPTISITPSSAISTSYNNGTLTLSFVPSGVSTARLTTAAGKSIVVLAMDKPTAMRWHAPIIAGEGEFGAFFGVGTNETVLVGGPYVVRTADISGNTLYLVRFHAFSASGVRGG
jgi:hypothetical protein